VRISKSMGHVADAFSEKTLEKLPGTIAIGHVRYSTAGDSKADNAQPILINCAHGQIAIGHNGNLVNAIDLRDELVRQGSIFQTTTDTEVILHLYARSRASSTERSREVRPRCSAAPRWRRARFTCCCRGASPTC